mgnify:FL=1
MTNLVKALGSAYFFERYNDKLAIYEGEAVIRPVELATNVSVVCRVEATKPGTSRFRVGDSVVVPFAFFESFDTFKFPEGGYIPHDGGCYYVARTLGRVFSSGFSVNSMKWNASNTTAYLETLGVRPAMRAAGNAKALGALIFPEYDDTSALDEVLKGKRTCYVPNRRVVIEPTVRAEYDLYDVFVDGMVLGSLTPAGTISKNTAKNNLAAIKGVLENVS